MDSLSLLISLLYAPSVADLGNSDYAVRDTAHRRLAAAGCVAAPALHRGVAVGSPEQRHRCGILLDRLPDLDDLVTTACLQSPPPRWAGEVLAIRPAALSRVCRRIDERGEFSSVNSEQWIRMTPYMKGVLYAEIQHVLDMAEGRRRKPKYLTGSNP